MPKQSLFSLYSSFIKSHVLYGILNWGCASKTILEPLKRNLRKAVRIIDSPNCTAHSEHIFKRLKIFNFDKLYMLEIAKMIFQINKNTSNKFLQDEFMKTKNLHKYNTRQSSSEGFSLLSIRTNYKKSFLTFDGIKLWNSLPTELKKLHDKHHFVKQTKDFLLNNF